MCIFAHQTPENMNLLNFINQYPDEEHCKKKWREVRESQGVTCPKCGCKEHYWKGDKEMFECKKCGHRQSLKANTIMHGSQLPFRYWFVAMHLLTSTKKSFSAMEMQRQLGHKYYKPIWAMMQKLHDAMGKRDDKYKLDGVIELDEGFFTVEVADDDKGEPLKRGRGSQRKCKVLVMTESEPVDNSGEGEAASKASKPRKVGHIKMKVIEDLKAETLNSQVEKNITPESKLTTDDSTSYTNFENIVTEHNHKVIPKEDIGKALPWVHIAISNAKRLLLDIYHDITPKYLQGYLNEFTYKFNRRYFGERLFDRLLIAGVTCKNEFRYRIT